MKLNQEWGFTAAPDFPRICRELAQAGCVVGLVTMKGERPVTLIDTRTAKVPDGVASRAIVGAPEHWRIVADDRCKAALGIRPVRVEGFTPTRLTEPYPWEKANAEDRARMASLRMFIARHADSTWTTGDGTKVRVQAMSDSHLHYAIAKAYRNEYPDSASRLAGIEVLKAEAARRLLRTWGLAPEPSKHSGPHVAVDLETAEVQLFGTGGAAGGTSSLFDFKTDGGIPKGPFLVAEAQRRVEAATRSLIGEPVVLTPEGRLAAQKKIQQTIQDSLGEHYAVGVTLSGGPFGLTANVTVDEKPSRPYAPDMQPIYMRSPFDR